MNLTTFTQTKTAMIAALLPLCKAHSRITITDEDPLLPIYIGGAVDAAENYLDRDVWPTARAYTGALPFFCGEWNTEASLRTRGYRFEFRRGVSTGFAAMAGATNVTADATLIRSVDPRTWGFTATFETDPGSVVISLTSGFATVAAMPTDLLSFILASFGMLFEIRELGAYVTDVKEATILPTYLLAAWANPTIA